MPERDREFRRVVSRECLWLMARRRSADITFAELADAVDGVSSRTLRRHFPSVAAAAYAATWWLPGAVDGIHLVLKPRERTGPCWPADLDDPEIAAAARIDHDGDHFEWPPAEYFESRGIPDPLHPGTVSPQPITLGNLLTDLRVLDDAWARRTGYEAIKPVMADIRNDHPELDAWYFRALHRRADALAPALARVFAIDAHAARAVAHAYTAIAETALPSDVAAHLAGLAPILSTGVAVPVGANGPIPAGLRAIPLPVRPPEPATIRRTPR